MSFAHIVVGILSLPAMLVLSNLFFRGVREARGVELLLADRPVLQQIVTKSLLANPPAEIVHFARSPYQASFGAFQEADRQAHAKARGMLRIATALVLVGSGIVGFLGVGWWGLAFPIINLVIMQSTFVGSTNGAPDRPAMNRAIEHVQVLAVILCRWLANDPRGASAWLDGQPQFEQLSNLVRDLDAA